MTAPAIEVSNLVRKFGNLVAVNNISFRIFPGEVFALLGPNGAGKTTTVRMLATLLRPTSGVAVVNGFDVVRSASDVRRSLGIVFQEQSIDAELTALENMDFHGILYRMSKSVRRRRTEELLRLVQLWDRREELVKYYSGGMKRQLEIARGLLHNPKILFLDEPTIGLDPQTRNSIWRHLLALNRSKATTIVFTTQQIQEAERMACRVAIFDGGSIVEQGDPQDIVGRTHTASLELAFLSLTGNSVRHEPASVVDYRRVGQKAWSR